MADPPDLERGVAPLRPPEIADIVTFISTILATVFYFFLPTLGFISPLSLATLG